MKNYKKSTKRLIISILLTIIISFLCAPIYSDTTKGLLYSRYDNKHARIDITNQGDNSNSLEIIDFKAPSYKKTDFPAWCTGKNGNCAMMHTGITSSWKDYVIKFKIIGDGKIKIALRGPDVLRNNKRFPVLVDYRFASVDNKPILFGRQSFWHDKSFWYSFEGKDSQIIELKFQARKYHLRLDDLGIDFLLLLSIIIISFLLSYKFVQYISKFKLENNSRIDIVFLIIFFGLLFIPMSHISNAEKSEQEKRILAKYPQFLMEKGINSNFGEQFDTWFNDRFFGRDWSIGFYYKFLYFINGVVQNNKAILFKNTGWMFNKPFEQYPDSQRDINEIISSLQKFDDFCNENNIKLYILIVPKKESVYSEFLPKYDDEQNQRFQEYVAKIQNALPDNRIIYPYDELKQAAKKDFVFFKQSHHWTDWGAYNGYKMLMQRIVQDFPDVHISQLDEYKEFTSKFLREDWNRKFGLGHTTGLLNINSNYAKESLLTDDYKYYDNKNMINPTIVDKDFYKIKHFRNTKIDNVFKVFLIGTSMNEDLLQFIPYSFMETKYFRLNNVLKVPNAEEFKIIKRHKSDILAFKPDILILSITSYNLTRLIDLFKD